MNNKTHTQTPTSCSPGRRRLCLLLAGRGDAQNCGDGDGWHVFRPHPLVVVGDDATSSMACVQATGWSAGWLALLAGWLAGSPPPVEARDYAMSHFEINNRTRVLAADSRVGLMTMRSIRSSSEPWKASMVKRKLRGRPGGDDVIYVDILQEHRG